jgi:YidC/Oxa1 family membrane protein insertase
MAMLGSFLYTILIWPIELLIGSSLHLTFQITQSYGLAIIGVSVLVSTLLIPMYRFAEKLQRQEREIQAVLRPKIAALQATYKGGDLYERMNDVYKQHHYHPLHAARASLGVMIQIPFFIAAYRFLATHEPLQGQAFLMIADLGKPDALLALGALSVNVLPLLMTLFNVLAARVYAKDVPAGEMLQMYMVAAMFLVLLYGSPAGLLLYWTCNNLYTLVRNLITAREATISDIKSQEAEPA